VATYRDSLNTEQRRAVKHGVDVDGTIGSPLLVIAGAGSGKTNTLAHRVAHLIVNGADPRRILLMTFSRRAAAEMTRRVERITRQVLGNNASVMTDALTLGWYIPRNRRQITAGIFRTHWPSTGVYNPRSRRFKRLDEPSSS
jgi:superfamily I DNA/RNA helicase